MHCNRQYSCYCSWKLISPYQTEILKFGRMQHVKFIAWNKWKIWKPKQNEITATVHYYHTTYCSCSCLVDSVHECFTATNSHLYMSQHQASLKHENLTLSYHSYASLLPQNNLQLQIKYYFHWQIHNIESKRSYYLRNSCLGNYVGLVFGLGWEKEK